MSKVCLICADRRFARMLELELGDMGVEVKAVTEKLNPPALALAAASASMLLFDSEYYNRDLSFVEKCGIPTVLFSREKLDNLPPNVSGFFERPFLVSELKAHIGDNTGDGKESDMPVTLLNGSVHLELDPFSKMVTAEGLTVRFSPREFALLSLLYKNRGRIVSRKEVLDTVWGEDYDSANNVDNVYVNYLRKKLDEPLGVKLIYTVRGKGYMMK